MIDTMTVIWWLLFASGLGAVGVSGWQAWKSANETESNFFADVALLAVSILFSLLSAATICALQFAGG